MSDARRHATEARRSAQGRARLTGPKSIADVIARTKQTLAFVQLGLRDLVESDDLQRQIAGVAHVMTFGQAVTIVLQHTRTFDRERFDAWWLPRSEQLRKDDLCRYFWSQRNVVLKEGYPPITHTNRLYPEMAFAPTTPFKEFGSTGPLPNFTAPYGDYFKSSHIEAAMPLSDPVPSYVRLPERRSERIILLRNPPFQHLGRPIDDLSAQGLCSLYVRYLGDLVRDAIAEFGPATGGQVTSETARTFGD